MFYKPMFLEVRQGYPQPRRKRRTSSVSPKGSDPDSVRLKAALTQPVSGPHKYNVTVHYGVT